MENNCPKCNKPLAPADDLGLKRGDDEYFDCANSCGQFKISRSLLRSLPERLQADETRVLFLRHYLRKMQTGKETPYLRSDLVDKIFQATLPDLPDQSKHLILWLGNNTAPGERVEDSFEVFQAVMGAKSIEGTQFIIDHSVEGGFLLVCKTTAYGSG
jgi:hypothetical protein